MSKNSPFEKPPEKDKSPIPTEFILASAVKSMGILQIVGVIELLIITPELDMPSPWISIFFHVDNVCPCKSNTPPESITTELFTFPVQVEES